MCTSSNVVKGPALIEKLFGDVMSLKDIFTFYSINIAIFVGYTDSF